MPKKSIKKRPEIRISDIDPAVKKKVDELADKEKRSAGRQAEWIIADWLKIMGA